MENCPALRMMNLLGKKWVLVVIKELSIKNMRFNEISKGTGINSRTLSKRLKELERLKVIKRHSFNEIPPKVEYSLTNAGKELMKSFKNIDKWIGEWKIKI